MEWMGLVSFMLVLYCGSYIDRIKRVERKVKKLGKKGENVMSKMIMELVGQKCKMAFQDGIWNPNILEILDADEDWVKLKEITKKEEKIKLIRLDQIEKIEVLKA